MTPNTPHRSSTKTLIGVMRMLARDIESPDGIANEAIREAAERLALLQNLLRECLPHIQASHGAEHMLDGFNVRPIPAIDSLLERVMLEADLTKGQTP